MNQHTVCIVTGASRGLGLTLASALCQPDNHVVAIARSANPVLDEVASRNGSSLTWVETDLAHSQHLEHDIALLLELCQSIPCEHMWLINNAGTVHPVAPAGEYPAIALQHALSLNLLAPMILTGAFLHATRGRVADRRILNISSGAAHNAYEGWSVYCASKAALDHYTRVVAQEQARLPDGARIAAIAPGVMDTDMQSELRAVSHTVFPAHKRFVELKASGGLADTGSVAQALLAQLSADTFGQVPVFDIRDV